jgi:hypothetical protein
MISGTFIGSLLRYVAILVNTYRSKLFATDCVMKTRGERLRWARRKAGYKSASAAARALEMEVGTYNAHERAGQPGARMYEMDEAEKYGRKFSVKPLWLMTGKGESEWPQPPNPIDEGRLRRAMKIALEVEGSLIADLLVDYVVKAAKDEASFEGPEGEASFAWRIFQVRREHNQTEARKPTEPSSP